MRGCAGTAGPSRRRGPDATREAEGGQGALQSRRSGGVPRGVVGLGARRAVRRDAGPRPPLCDAGPGSRSGSPASRRRKWRRNAICPFASRTTTSNGCVMGRVAPAPRADRRPRRGIRLGAGAWPYRRPRTARRAAAPTRMRCLARGGGAAPWHHFQRGGDARARGRSGDRRAGEHARRRSRCGGRTWPAPAGGSGTRTRRTRSGRHRPPTSSRRTGRSDWIN